jgi:hypothetical protein
VKNQQMQILKLMVLNQPGLIIVESGVKLHKPKSDSIPDCSLDFCFLSIVSTKHWLALNQDNVSGWSDMSTYR